MSRSIYEQFLETVERAKSPLIVLRETADIDSFAAAFALAGFISTMEKPISIAVSGGNAPKSLAFLRQTATIHGDLPNIQKLIVQVATQDAQLESLTYHIEQDGIHIHLTPKSGAFNASNVIVNPDGYKYDLILSLGISELADIGDLFRRYTDFFYDTPIINIDHKPSNEHFGAVNMVDIRAVATSEIIYELIHSIDTTRVNEDIATACLAGMMHATQGFRSIHVTPKTLSIAGELMAKGAKRDEIVEHLYKTRSVETLRLWGRALARIKSHTESGLVWSLLTTQDFALSGTDASSLHHIIEELLLNAPNAKVGAIFYEDEEKHIRVLLEAVRPYDAIHLGSPFTASGTRESATLLLRNTRIQDAEKRVVEHLKKELQKML